MGLQTNCQDWKEMKNIAILLLLVATSLACRYDCDGWPYSRCLVHETEKYNPHGYCIAPYPYPAQQVPYSNYPECKDIPRGCQRCDDYCAQRDGRRNRNS